MPADRRQVAEPQHAPAVEQRSGIDRRSDHVNHIIVVTDMGTYEQHVHEYGELIEWAKEEHGCKLALLVQGSETVFPEEASGSGVCLADFRAHDQYWVFKHSETARERGMKVLLLLPEKGLPGFYKDEISKADSSLSHEERHARKRNVQPLPDDMITPGLIKGMISRHFASQRKNQAA